MIKLLETGAFAGRLPVSADGIDIAAVDITPMCLLTDARMAQEGLPLPKPTQSASSDAGRLMWVGPGQTMVMGTAFAGPGSVDQSDGWAIAELTGPRAVDVLSRLVAVDLRLDAFPVGASARTMIGHMTGSVIRTDDDSLQVMVMRSMAGTLVHDLARAIETSERG